MANISEKKRKLLILFQLLWEKTDDNHAMTLPELLRELENRGVTAERKSIYDDMETLRSMGVSIETKKSKTFQYYLGEHLFSPEELSLLATAIASAEFISSSQSEVLCRKLCTLCSNYQGELLLASQNMSVGEKRAEEKITLEFSAEQKAAVEKFFGPDLSAESAGKNHFRASLRTELGPKFFGWLFTQGTSVRVVSPKKLAEQLRERAKTMAKLYKS